MTMKTIGKVKIFNQASCYRGDSDFYMVVYNDEIKKQYIIEFHDAVNYALTLASKCHYRSEYYKEKQ